jgi:parvulin-like peptidyl-prolyl isomerase
MVEEFDIVVFSMTSGEISPVFRTQFGYHVVQVWDSRPERKMTREEAEQTIREILQRRNRDRLLLDWIAEKRKVAVIEATD